ncbi:MAG TPA: ATP synthase F1 subunit delta [Candidatus Hydrogenedentes bacterium]|nr:ATP synthase F1 subunit delta [Candidatus Hydrogenedentota bacterium]
MKNYLIAERYAKGLSASIADNEALDAARAALDDLADLYASHHDLRSALANPAIDRTRRKAVLNEVLGVLQPPPAVRRLAEILLERGRIALLPDVARVLGMLVDDRLHRVTAEVIAAMPLDDAQEARIRDALLKFSGKTVRLHASVDPEVLGGAVARIGGTVIDGSLRSRMERMKKALLAQET